MSEDDWHERPESNTDAFRAFTEDMNTNWDTIDNEFGKVYRLLAYLSYIVLILLLIIVGMGALVIF